MTQPLDRKALLPALGKVDREAGEFWYENPFMIPSSGSNLSAYERNRLFMSIEGRDFIDASFASGADIDSDSRAAVGADFDRDGAPDLLVASVGGGPLRLFLNRFPRTRRWVPIELVGTSSNRPAIGTRIIAEVGERRIVRDVFATNGSVGQSPPELLVGVGEATRIDRLTVRWPTGKTQQFTDVPTDSRVRIVEGRPQVETATLEARRQTEDRPE